MVIHPGRTPYSLNSGDAINETLHGFIYRVDVMNETAEGSNNRVDVINNNIQDLNDRVKML